MKQGSISPVRVVLIAAVLGTLGGVALSLHRQHVEELSLQAIVERTGEDGSNASPIAIDPPGKTLQSGVVRLTATEGLPQYPNAYARPLTSAPKDGGAELNIAWFSTRDSMDDVLTFYARQFEAKHKRSVVHQYSPFAGYAAYLDSHDHRLHMISVLVQQHETLVFASSSYPAKLLGAAAAPAQGVPAVAGAEGGLTFDLSAGLGPKRRLWTSTVKQSSLESVRDTYKQALAADGWKVTDQASQGAQEARFDATRGSGELQVMLRRDAASDVAVYVSVSGA